LRHKYHPGWSATIDGEPVSLWRTLGIYMGLLLPPGQHQVQLRYQEPGLRTGLLLAAGWLGVMLFASVAVARRVQL
jgi:uncharacterized membrane protein YfhO